MENGYSSHDDKVVVENQIVQYICNEGYTMTDHSTSKFICSNGEYLPKIAESVMVCRGGKYRCIKLIKYFKDYSFLLYFCFLIRTLKISRTLRI